MSIFARSLAVIVSLAIPVTTAPGQAPPALKPDARALPCDARPEHRQLDFWVGEWDVFDRDRKIATSSIQRLIEGCAIVENYRQVDGYQDTSVTFYDIVLGRWRQNWFDSVGNVSEFAGSYGTDSMQLAGETHRQDGTTVLRRMTLRSLGPDRVRQFSQRSVDGGKTWDVAYDFTYVRRK